MFFVLAGGVGCELVDLVSVQASDGEQQQQQQQQQQKAAMLTT